MVAYSGVAYGCVVVTYWVVGGTPVGYGFVNVGSVRVSYVLVAEARTPLSYRSVTYGARECGEGHTAGA